MDESTITAILSVAEIIISVALIVVILMQSKNASGLSGALGGMGQSNTYWDKNKGRSLEGKLTKYTKIFATLFIVLSLVISFLPSMYKSDTPQGTENGNAISVEPNSEAGIDVVPNDADNGDSAALENGNADNAVPEANSAQ